MADIQAAVAVVVTTVVVFAAAAAAKKRKENAEKLARIQLLDLAMRMLEDDSENILVGSGHVAHAFNGDTRFQQRRVDHSASFSLSALSGINL